VRSPVADSHLGQRLSRTARSHRPALLHQLASLRFIPVAEMAQAGYKAYLQPFIQRRLYRPSDRPPAKNSKP